MKILKVGAVPANRVDSPLFTGGEVTAQRLVTSEIARDCSFAIINFSAGSRNYFHTHSSDQILYITDGTGIVATEAEESLVNKGDVIHVPAGEKHWHGATKKTSMSHATITLLSSETTQLEP